jgi:NAD(P)-dependent dehydrogenase (short-subunit alcohol dehydrogenase family)
MDVAGKVAIVTGGAYGIGRAISLALADEGASVCVFDRSVESLNAVVDEIETRQPGRAIGVAGNAASTDDIARCIVPMLELPRRVSDSMIRPGVNRLTPICQLTSAQPICSCRSGRREEAGIS